MFNRSCCHETTKTSNFTCQSKSFISILSLSQVSACELQRFSCRELANEIYSQTAKTVFSHLKQKTSVACPLENLQWLSVTCFSTAYTQQQTVKSLDVSMSFQSGEYIVLFGGATSILYKMINTIHT